MADLSPAALQVFWEFNRAASGKPDDWHYLPAIAAALREAAADPNKQIDVPFSQVDQWENIKGSTLSYWTAAQWGYQKAITELLAIAAELEQAASNTTETL
jgi:hypothetical protein